MYHLVGQELNLAIIMYFSNAALLCSVLPALVGAFVPHHVSISRTSTSAPSFSSHLFMSDDDDDDDWFAEMDSQPQRQSGSGGRWDALNDYGSSGSFGRTSYGNRGGGGYGGRGGGRGGYNNGPYERDTTRDASNVDVAAVEALLDERAQYKKQRDYNAADEIRDTLLAEYSVGVDDRERTWRTGCSPGGSGLTGG